MNEAQGHYKNAMICLIGGILAAFIAATFFVNAPEFRDLTSGAGFQP